MQQKYSSTPESPPLTRLRSKEKKKKCDEQRPACARCIEKKLQCTYEAVKPRQRRRTNSLWSATAQSDISEPRGAEKNGWQSSDAVDALSDFELTSPVGPVGDRFDGQPLGEPLTAGDGPTSPHRNTRQDHPLDSAQVPDGSIEELCRINPDPDPDPESGTVVRASGLQPVLFDFHLPAYEEFSQRPHRRALVDHFCRTLSHLIVFREEFGNPFQQLVLPLSHSSPPVMNAMYALASAHLEYRGIDTGERSVHFHNEAIQGLACLIDGGTSQVGGGSKRRTELLAAIMLLVYYEVLVQKGRSNIVDGHLRGAFTILNSLPGDASPTSVFLERAFRFYDVITALSLGTAPLSTAPAAGCLVPFPPRHARAPSALSNVDTLLGMATTLWPIMHRLSNLLSLKAELDEALRLQQISKVAVLRTEFQTTSQAIEVALKKWQPKLPPNISLSDRMLEGIDLDNVFPGQPLLKAILHNALAYRASAFVYLYRTIYGYDPAHESVQRQVHAALAHCGQTVGLRGPMGALLWPLFVASCEALSPTDRALAETVFVQVEGHQGMINIEKAWSVVLAVWTQRDLLLSITPYGAKDADLWRKVSQEMGISIVFG